MSAVVDGLLVPTGSLVHRLPAHAKLLALVTFVALVVTIPPQRWWALVLAGVTVTAAARLARLPARTVLRRMVVEAPFVVFALLLPLLATGPRVDVLGLSLARDGLVGGWNLLAKATIGVLAAIVLAATTSARDLVAGLERLRLPPVLVQILAFMLRYLAVVTDDLRRMRIARESRGAPPGWWGQARAVAAGVGALFIRSYERGERVHQAMLARGWTGRSVLLTSQPASAADWATVAVLPLLGALLAVAARVSW